MYRRLLITRAHTHTSVSSVEETSLFLLNRPFVLKHFCFDHTWNQSNFALKILWSCPRRGTGWLYHHPSTLEPIPIKTVSTCHQFESRRDSASESWLGHKKQSAVLFRQWSSCRCHITDFLCRVWSTYWSYSGKIVVCGNKIMAAFSRSFISVCVYDSVFNFSGSSLLVSLWVGKEQGVEVRFGGGGVTVGAEGCPWDQWPDPPAGSSPAGPASTWWWCHLSGHGKGGVFELVREALPQSFSGSAQQWPNTGEVFGSCHVLYVCTDMQYIFCIVIISFILLLQNIQWLASFQTSSIFYVKSRQIFLAESF